MDALRCSLVLMQYVVLSLAFSIAAQSFATEVVVPLEATWKYLSPNGAAENPDINEPTFDIAGTGPTSMIMAGTDLILDRFGMERSMT